MKTPEEKDIRDEKILIFKNRYLPLGVLVAILLWVLSSGYLGFNKFILEPKDKMIKQYQKNLDALQAELDTNLKNLAELEERYKITIEKMERVFLLKPRDRDKIISEQVELKWDFDDHGENTQYIIEIRFLDKGKGRFERYNVPHSGDKVFYYPIQSGHFGEYIWRVKPGRIIGNSEVSQGDWSEYNSFTVYKQVRDRIQKTGVITVGMSPTFAGSFNLYDEKGGFKGFDVDLIQEVGRKLSEKLKKSLEVQIVETPWNNLLEKLRDHELDMVISSMTKTIKRENKYRIKYTNGYFTSHQIFVTRDFDYNKNISLKKNLSGKKVGVTNETTNQKIAHFLSKEYDFSVKDDFSRLAGVIQAFDGGIIDLALTDNTLAVPEIKSGRLKSFGGYLDKEAEGVKEFNLKNIGWEQEEYAIAVHKGDEQLLIELNEILNTEFIQKKIKELSVKWELDKLEK